MLGWLTRQIARFGCGGVFVFMIVDGLGVPFPGQTLLAFSGFLASRGVLPLGLLLLAGIGGGYVGTLGGFLLVRYWGERWLRVLTRRADWLEQGEAQVRGLADRYGIWLLVFGRFLPTVGNTAPYFVAMSRTPLWQFALVDLLGVCLWAGGPMLAGFFLGEEWLAVGRWLGPIGRVLLLAIAVALATWWVWRRLRARLPN